MQLRRKGLLLVLGLGMLLAVAGCSTAVRAERPVARVAMNEWSLRADSSFVQAGQVTLDVVNQGQAEHEVVVLRTDLAANALKMKANGAEVDESASGQIMGEVEDIGPGQTKTVTLDLPPGHYVLICNIMGHYMAGMVTEFTVAS